MKLTYKYLILIILQLYHVESFLKQSDLLTKLFNNEIKKFRFHTEILGYKLILDNKLSILFDSKFLEVISENEVKKKFFFYDSFELEKNITLKLLSESGSDFNFFWVNEKNQERSSPLNSYTNIKDPVITFINQGVKFECFVYYSSMKDDTNRTIFKFYLNTLLDGSHLVKFNWKRKARKSSQLKVQPKAFSVEKNHYFLIYDDTDDQLDLDMPFIAFFGISNLGDFERIVQFPVLCSDNYDDVSLKQNLYKNLVDSYGDINESGISFYFLFRSIDQIVVCFVEESVVSNSIGLESKDLSCEETKDERGMNIEFCDVKLKSVPKNPILIRLDKQTFKRILAKTIIDEEGAKTRIVFLLDDLNRLHIYDITSSLQLCYEGVFNLINQKTDEILDIYLHEQEDMIVILTKNYLQKIPIRSFCTSSSLSACVDSKSTCHINQDLSPICNDKDFKGRKCVMANSTVRIRSELYLCDRDRKEMCLAGDSEKLTPEIKESLTLCDENSCLCEYQYCLQKRCDFDSTEKKFCPLPKSSMKLSKYSPIYQLEPFHIIIFSKLITLLIITFILVSFYCCFSSSISQSSKKANDLSMNSDLKTI